MPEAVLLGGDQEAAHCHEVLGLVAEVDDDAVLAGLLASQHRALSLAGKE